MSRSASHPPTPLLGRPHPDGELRDRLERINKLTPGASPPRTDLDVPLKPNRDGERAVQGPVSLRTPGPRCLPARGRPPHGRTPRGGHGADGASAAAQGAPLSSHHAKPCPRPPQTRVPLLCCRISSARSQVPFYQKDRVQKLCAALRYEDQVNQYENARCKGSVVTYSTIVELKHVKSGRLLCLAPKKEQDKSLARELTTTLYSNKGSWYASSRRAANRRLSSCVQLPGT